MPARALASRRPGKLSVMGCASALVSRRARVSPMRAQQRTRDPAVVGRHRGRGGGQGGDLPEPSAALSAVGTAVAGVWARADGRHAQTVAATPPRTKAAASGSRAEASDFGTVVMARLRAPRAGSKGVSHRRGYPVECVPMRKSLLFLGQIAALGLVGLALSTRVIADAPAHATAWFLAGGVSPSRGGLYRDETAAGWRRAFFAGAGFPSCYRPRPMRKRRPSRERAARGRGGIGRRAGFRFR